MTTSKLIDKKTKSSLTKKEMLDIRDDAVWPANYGSVYANRFPTSFKKHGAEPLRSVMNGKSVRPDIVANVKKLYNELRLVSEGSSPSTYEYKSVDQRQADRLTKVNQSAA